MAQHATLRFHIDVGPFIRSAHDAGHAFASLGYQAQGLTPPPKRPYPRRVGQLTARQYRAARRAHARARRTWQRIHDQETQ